MYSVIGVALSTILLLWDLYKLDEFIDKNTCFKNSDNTFKYIEVMFKALSIRYNSHSRLAQLKLLWRRAFKFIFETRIRIRHRLRNFLL